HPCSVDPTSLKYDKAKLSKLLNWVQRHKICSSYCLRRRKVSGQADPEQYCHFEFPKELRNEAGFATDSKNRVHFEPRRNDALVNSYNPALSLGWLANTDIKPVLSKAA
ncbi:hypothetical protein K435DRAFT_639769, partial [Dendrothele bispora CBS 962.96]